ncbi:hypothetical protein MMC19_005367 [Ptychographa xylographoides]|nr:hypothetical protein [Ptychographa xylographoides]
MRKRVLPARRDVGTMTVTETAMATVTQTRTSGVSTMMGVSSSTTSSASFMVGDPVQVTASASASYSSTLISMGASPTSSTTAFTRPSTTAIATVPASPSQSSSKPVPTAEVAGLAIGAVALLLLLTYLTWFFVRRHNRNLYTSFHNPVKEYPTILTPPLDPGPQTLLHDKQELSVVNPVLTAVPPPYATELEAHEVPPLQKWRRGISILYGAELDAAHERRELDGRPIAPGVPGIGSTPVYEVP